jgi:hypothetical protein
LKSLVESVIAFCQCDRLLPAILSTGPDLGAVVDVRLLLSKMQ